VRRAAGVLAAIIVAVAGVVGLIAFFSGRDSAPVSRTSSGPGQEFADQGAALLAPGQRPPQPYNSDPPTSGPHALTALAAGNVVLFYGTPQPSPRLRSLASYEAGPFDPPLAQAGQAVILAPRPGTAGVVAVAWRHLLRAPSPTDPALRTFVEGWLGVGRQ
jgi:hypothetical protein